MSVNIRVNKANTYENEFIYSTKEVDLETSLGKNDNIQNNIIRNVDDNKKDNLINKNAQMIDESIKFRKKNKNIQLCAKIFKMMFSNIGLVLFVFLYSTLGALMFQLLEQHEELRLCEEGKGKFLKELKHYREDMILFVIYNISNNPDNNQQSEFQSYLNLTKKYKKSIDDLDFNNSSLSKSSIKQNQSVNESYNQIDKMLHEFRKKIIEIETNFGYYGQDCSKETKWNFFSSLLFTITVMSTVGYGFISPLTWEGQVVCICYSLIGIPIFLLCLTNLSSSLGHVLRFVYKKFDSINPIKKFLKERKQIKKINRKKSKALLSKKSIATNDNSSFNDQNIIVLQDGVSTTRSELSSSYFIRDLDEYNVAFDYSLSEDDVDDEGEYEQTDEIFFNETEVPISLALLIIISYLVFGAYMFQRFEDWSFIKSIYFVFVTLTTLGFGDLVPGLKSDDKYANMKLLFVCFYSLFGMAIIGMCLSVMQYACKRKFLWLLKQFKKFINCSNKYQKKRFRKNSFRCQEKEREEILNKIRMLQEYENEISGKKRRKNHVLN